MTPTKSGLYWHRFYDDYPWLPALVEANESGILSIQIIGSDFVDGDAPERSKWGPYIGSYESGKSGCPTCGSHAYDERT